VGAIKSHHHNDELEGSKKMATIKLKPIARATMTFGIRGTSPIIMHQWSEKAKSMMRDKQQEGKKTRERELRKPADEAEAATYRTVSGDVGIPAMAFKAAILTAAHKDIGIEKTLVRKAMFLRCDDPGLVIPFTECDEPIIREDMVRVGMGSADLRYRPEFRNWKASVELEIDAELLQDGDVLALVGRAGFGVGLCEWRPEKGGEFGRFEIDSSVPVRFEKSV
jgi:hypothetical protein